MNHSALVRFSSLVGLAAGCSNVLGMDENKPVLDCTSCGPGSTCDAERIRCVPIGTAGASAYGTPSSGGVTGGGVGGTLPSSSWTASNGGATASAGTIATGGTVAIAGTISGGTATASGGTFVSPDTTPVSGGTIGNGGTAFGAAPTGGGGSGNGGNTFGGTPTGGTESTGGDTFTTLFTGGTSNSNGGAGGIATIVGGTDSGGASDGGTTSTGGSMITGGSSGAGGTTTGGSGSSCLLTLSKLPMPCRGNRYDESFSVTGGEPDYQYTWTTDPASPPGITFEANRVHGIPTERVKATVRVTDGSGLCKGESSYDLVPRDKCWLAYISNEEAPAKLRLYDPVLKNRVTIATNSITPIAVTDFKFAPDGNALAYRLGNNQLLVARGPDWKEVLELGLGSVTQYEWSPDASVLAAAYATGADADSPIYLGGIRLPHTAGVSASGASGASANGGGDAGDTPGFFRLQPIEITIDTASELTWFGLGRFAAYHAPTGSPERFQVVRFARLDEGGFVSALALDQSEYTSSVYLKSAETGFFAVDSGVIDFWDVPPDVSTKYDIRLFSHATTAVAPDGRYSAGIVDPSVGFRVYPSSNPTAPAASSDSACPTLLAWGAVDEQELIVCVANNTDSGDTRGEIRIFKLTPGNPSLQMSAVLGEYGSNYREGDSYLKRRAVSTNGEWFSFLAHPEQGTTFIYTAALSGGSPRIVPDYTSPIDASTAVAGLEFSPSSQWLLVQLDNRLVLRALDSLGTTWYLNDTTDDDALVGTPACNESLTSSPLSWCGNAQTPAGFTWATDSGWLAYKTATGKLRTVELNCTPAPPCASQSVCSVSQCAGEFAVQP